VTAADACPGILDLHQARDGLVARIRLPGGYASAARLRSLAALGDRFGDGCVDLTARGNVQLRGIRAETAGQLAERAAAAGLLPSPAHDRARNIAASPLAGLAGHRDLRGPVRALDRAILADRALAGLPGRFLFALDDGTGRAGLGRCDVGLCFAPGGAELVGAELVVADLVGAELVVAGRRTGRRGPAAEMIERAVAAARAFLAERGSAPGGTRVRGLPDGGAAVAAAAGGALGEPVPGTETRLRLGALRDAASVVVVAAPLGRLTARQLRLVAGLARPGDIARLSAAGRIVLPVAGAADTALARLAAAGLVTGDDHPLAGVTACAGMTCARSLADVRAVAAKVPGLDAAHWAGCDRRCGLPADATAVVATSAGQYELDDGAARRVLSLAALGRPA
jgi:precorrin-3B synthase